MNAIGPREPTNVVIPIDPFCCAVLRFKVSLSTSRIEFNGPAWFMRCLLPGSTCKHVGEGGKRLPSIAEKDFGFEEADDALGQRIVHCPFMGHENVLCWEAGQCMFTA